MQWSFGSYYGSIISYLVPKYDSYYCFTLRSAKAAFLCIFWKLGLVASWHKIVTFAVSASELQKTFYLTIIKKLTVNKLW